MSEESSGGCGCLGFIIVIAAGIFLVLVGFYGYAPETAAVIGLKWGVGCWAIPVGALLLLAIISVVHRDVKHLLWRRSTRKWEDLDD